MQTFDQFALPPIIHPDVARAVAILRKHGYKAVADQRIRTVQFQATLPVRPAEMTDEQWKMAYRQFFDGMAFSLGGGLVNNKAVEVAKTANPDGSEMWGLRCFVIMPLKAPAALRLVEPNGATHGSTSEK